MSSGSSPISSPAARKIVDAFAEIPGVVAILADRAWSKKISRQREWLYIVRASNSTTPDDAIYAANQALYDNDISVRVDIVPERAIESLPDCDAWWVHPDGRFPLLGRDDLPMNNRGISAASLKRLQEGIASAKRTIDAGEEFQKLDLGDLGEYDGVEPDVMPHTAREHAAYVLGLPDDFEDHIWRIPRQKVIVNPKDLDAWIENHQHPEKNHGAIGGGITRHETPTSIGVLRHVFCSFCREEAYVDDPH